MEKEEVIQINPCGNSGGSYFPLEAPFTFYIPLLVFTQMANPAYLPKQACLVHPHLSPTLILKSKVYLSHVLFSWSPDVGQV